MTRTSLAVDCHLKYNRVEGNTPNVDMVRSHSLMLTMAKMALTFVGKRFRSSGSTILVCNEYMRLLYKFFCFSLVCSLRFQKVEDSRA
jgi:hypothetical protein